MVGVARAIATIAAAVQRPQHQYGVIPYRLRKDQVEIMLITSRNARRWVIPKGWPIGRKPPRDVARIEALEEAGLEGKLGKQPVGFFHYRKRLASGAAVLCRVEVFALAVRRQRKTWLESHERTRQWFATDRAIELVRETELKELIARVARALTQPR